MNRAALACLTRRATAFPAAFTVLSRHPYWPLAARKDGAEIAGTPGIDLGGSLN
jgi:hypothetical protein